MIQSGRVWGLGKGGCCGKKKFQSILAHDEIHDVLLMDNKHKFLEMMLLLLAT